jgi:excisionase family DNA binding protein
MNWKIITQTILDGFSPLDTLIERSVRPGSNENLIQVDGYPIPTIKAVSEPPFHQNSFTKLEPARAGEIESLSSESRESAEYENSSTAESEGEHREAKVNRRGMKPKSGLDVHEVMDIRQASEYLGVASDVLYKYACEGFVPAFKLGDRWRFKKSRLDEWLDRQADHTELSDLGGQSQRKVAGSLRNRA